MGLFRIVCLRPRLPAVRLSDRNRPKLNADLFEGKERLLTKKSGASYSPVLNQSRLRVRAWRLTGLDEILLTRALRFNGQNDSNQMAKFHNAKQGDTLSSIAREYGFRSYRTIFDHPSNADLKSKRDPHVLFPGDQIFIPDLEQKMVDRPVDNLHHFVIPVKRLFLRLRILDINGRQLKNTRCDLGVDENEGLVAKETDAKGVLEHPISPNAHNGEVVAHHEIQPDPDPIEQRLKFDLKIGHLNPETKLSGQQARLNNLGYFAGFSHTDLDQLLWAAEEFACEKIGKPVTKRPKILPSPPEGEEDESASDPNQPTGIMDRNITDKLKAEHGI